MIGIRITDQLLIILMGKSNQLLVTCRREKCMQHALSRRQFVQSAPPAPDSLIAELPVLCKPATMVQQSGTLLNRVSTEIFVI